MELLSVFAVFVAAKLAVMFARLPVAGLVLAPFVDRSRPAPGEIVSTR